MFQQSNIYFDSSLGFRLAFVGLQCLKPYPARTVFRKVISWGRKSKTAKRDMKPQDAKEILDLKMNCTAASSNSRVDGCLLVCKIKLRIDQPPQNETCSWVTGNPIGCVTSLFLAELVAMARYNCTAWLVVIIISIVFAIIITTINIVAFGIQFRP